MTALLWIIIIPVGWAVVTGVAGRLLGAKRGWVALSISGVAGFAAAIVAAGELSDWNWASLDMVAVALGLGVLFTMLLALGIDLAAPVGSLASGDAAGLVTVRNPVRAVGTQVAPFRRYREVLAIARREGVIARSVNHDELPSGVRRTLESAGGIFVKLGQVASTRSDVLPAAWCEELSLLRSSAEPQPESVIRPHIERELGAAPETVYETFDWTPIASASMAQVYRATLRSDAADATDVIDVVVKVQRTGLSETIATDRAAIMQLARLVQRRTPLGLSVQPEDLAQEFIESVEEELDFTVEARNGIELADGLAQIDGIRVPALFLEHSSSKVLTEEFISAPSIADERALAELDVSRTELADRLIGAFMHQIFSVGVFHADPHPGNILIEPDGTIVLIDLGAVGRIGPRNRAAVLELLAAASAGNALALREALEQISLFDRRIDTRVLDAALETFLARNMTSGGGITATAFEDLASLIGDFGIRLPRWFGTLTRTMVSLEGTLKIIDPDFSLVDAARQHAEASFGRPSVEGLKASVEQELLHQLPRLRRVPERIDELFGKALGGQLSASVSILSDERDVRLVTRLVDRLVLALVAAATGVGSAILVSVEAGPTFGGSISINEILGYAGIAASAVLALRVVANIVRDGVV
jgi:ubiquinone biosynthesis protein